MADHKGFACTAASSTHTHESQPREPSMMEPRLLQRFTQLIASHTGLQLREEETDKLRHIIQARMAAQQLIKPEAYHQLLTIDSAASRREWEELVLPLTNGESYFFRDSGQFSLLRQQIIPELIERNSGTRSLRICSRRWPRPSSAMPASRWRWCSPRAGTRPRTPPRRCASTTSRGRP